MPANKRTQVIKPSPVNGTFFCNGEQFVLPKENRATLETRIINHVRILDSVTTTAGRELIKAALKANKHTIHIGLDPYGGSDRDVGETSDHPMSPNYRYSGHDIRKLEPLLITDRTILECTATLSYGDGGISVDSDDDVESALDVIIENYRESELHHYFSLLFHKTHL